MAALLVWGVVIGGGVTARGQFVPQAAESSERANTRPDVALAEGILSDDMLRDPSDAAAWFRVVLSSEGATAGQKQEATWRLARCLRRLNRPDAARPLLESLAGEDSLPEEIRAQVRSELAAMPLVAPSRLMPADTLIYIEIPNPGRTIERWIDVLRRAGMESAARRTLALLLRERGALEIGALLNESMQEELKKVAGLGIGWHNFRVETVEGRRALAADVLFVLYTGQSATAANLLRGVVVALLVPETTIEGVGFFASAGPRAEFRYAMADGLFVACTDARGGADAVLRHDGRRRGPTLHALPAFKSRPTTLAPGGEPLVFVDWPRLLAEIVKLQPDDSRAEFESLVELFGLHRVGPLFASLTATDDRVDFDLSISAPADGGTLMRLFRTPPLDPTWLSWAPRSAAFSVVTAVTPGDRRWLDFERFTLEADRLFGRQSAGGRVAGEPLAAARLVERISGLKIADDLLAPVRGAALVWLAGVGEDSADGFPPFVLSVEVDEPEAWVRRLERGLRQFLYGDTPEAAQPPKVVLDTPVGRVETVTVLSTGLAWQIRGRRVSLATSAASLVRYLAAPAREAPARGAATPVESKSITMRADVLLRRQLPAEALSAARTSLAPMEITTVEDEERIRIRARQPGAAQLLLLLSEWAQTSRPADDAATP